MDAEKNGEEIQNDDNDQTPKLILSQSPGNFVLFWNVVVPLSLFLNIRHFGLRAHELGLLFALSLNQYILNYIVKFPIICWLVLLFLIIWIERILKRWPWYRIYTACFFKTFLLFVGFIIIPAAVIHFVFPLLSHGLQGTLTRINPSLSPNQVVAYRNIGLLTFSVILLLLSLYFHKNFKGCFHVTT